MHGKFVGTAKWTAIKIKEIAMDKTVRRVVSKGFRINGKERGDRYIGLGHELLTPTPSIPLLKADEPPEASKFVGKSCPE
jgi:hypothetical protein